MRTLRVTLIAAALTLLAACSDDEKGRDPDLIPAQPGDGDASGAADMGSSDAATDTSGGDGTKGDTGNSTDGGGDDGSGADSGPDFGDIPYGMTCPEPVGTYSGACDLITGAGCPANEVCLVVLDVNGQDVRASADCLESDRHTLPEGEPCLGTEQRCAPGLFCISFIGECQRLCWLDDAQGCESGSYCRRVSDDIDGFGYCADACP